MADKEQGEYSVVIPLGLTDFAKALRELIGAFRDASGIVGDAVKLIKRRNAGKAADNLDYLGFSPDGFLYHLKKIANGQGDLTNIDALEVRLQATQEEVTRRIFSLRNYRDKIREHCGAAASQKFDEIVDGPNGKFTIRYEISSLIQQSRRNDSISNGVQQAQSIVEKIEFLNDSLIGLHDLIFPPRGAPT